jgi:PAS domain S-box-containing protein
MTKKAENKLHILMLEDNAYDAELIQYELKKAGIAFDAAVVNTREAYLEALKRFRPDIILSDYDLPRYEGIQALAEAKKHCRDLPFILVTGAVTEDRAVEVLTSGARDYVLKSKLNRLVPAVQRALAEAEEHKARKRAEEKLRLAYRNLENQVSQRTADLRAEIAERKRAEEDLKKSEERFRNLFQNVPNVAVQGYGPNGVVLYWNRASERLYGYTASEAIGRNISDLIIPPELRDETERDIARATETGRPPPAGEQWRLKKDGSRVPVFSSCSLIRIRGRDPELFCVDIDLSVQKRAEQEIRASEERLRLFIETAPVSIAMFDRRMCYLSASRRWLSDYKLGDRSLAGLCHYSVFPEISAEWKEAHRLGMAGIVQRVEGDRFERSDGSVQWQRWEIQPWRNHSGEVGGIVIFTEDVTELKKTEEALERYRLLAEHTRDIIFFFRRRDGRILEANAAAEHAYGYTREELLALSVHDLRAPEARDSLEYHMEEADRRGILFETLHRRKDGSLFHVEVGSRGETIGGVRTLVSVIRDITKRKKAEEVVKSSEEQFRRAIDESPIPIIMQAEDGRVIHISKSWTELTGFRLDDMPTMDAWLNCAYGEGAGAVRDHMKALFKGNKRSVNVEYSIRTARGEIRRWSFNASSPGTLYDGRRFIIGMIVDITERMRAEEERERLINELANSNRELESFSYSVSHDLRAPLRVIDGFSRMLLGDEQELKEESKRKIQVIRKSAENMDRLIQDLLLFSKSSQTPLARGRIDMNRLVGEVCREQLNANPDRQISFQTENLPEAEGDKTLIRQVMSNLVANAVKFTRKRKRALITIGGTQAESENIYRIDDNGAGFDMKYYDRLFGVFARLHSESDYEGTGIGLAIVQRIVHRHGGRVWAEGRLGKGATFYFSLPKG